MCKQCDKDNKLIGASTARDQLLYILKRKPNWGRTELMEEFDRWYRQFERESRYPEDYKEGSPYEDFMR